MAVVVIGNSCIAGAMAGLMAGRFKGSFTPTDYAAIANAAAAINTQFLAENTASGAAIADGDNAEVGPLVQACAFGAVFNTGAVSGTATDYTAVGKQIYASAKEALTKLS